MAFPTPILEVAFTTAPLASSPVWVNITDYLRQVQTRRGRQRELDTFDAGTASFLVDDQDRRFDSTNTAGPYYGYLLPMRKIRFGITVGATTYYLYTGYVETFQPVWDSAFTAACRIDCIDGFDIVANAVLTAGTRGSELTGARIGWALDAVGWPAADRDIDTGQTLLPAFTVTAGSEPSALSHLMDVADSELGAVFIKADGRAAFFDRHRTLKSPYTTSQATFGDTSDTDIPYEALAPSYDRDLIRNDIKITRPGGSTQTATDSASQSAYGRRTHTRAPLLTTDTEALNMAQYLAGAYAQPALRFESITLEPLEDDNLWDLVGDLEVWDRVTVKRTPPGGGSAIVQDCLIEGIEHRGSPSGSYWQTTYQLSPANTTLFLVLDDIVNGVLDSARLAY